MMMIIINFIIIVSLLIIIIARIVRKQIRRILHCRRGRRRHHAQAAQFHVVLLGDAVLAELVAAVALEPAADMACVLLELARVAVVLQHAVRRRAPLAVAPALEGVLSQQRRNCGALVAARVVELAQGRNAPRLLLLLLLLWR